MIGIRRFRKVLHKSRFPSGFHIYWLLRRHLFVEIDNERVGFFAQLNWCLHIFFFARKHGLTPHVALISANYRVTPDERDWLASFFFPVLGNGLFSPPAMNMLNGNYTKRVHHIDQLRLGARQTFSLNEAHEIFFANLKLRPDIEEEVAHFSQMHFDGRKVLGVHYRGTDKSSEAPRVPYETALAAIQRNIVEEGFNLVFVSTDETAFLDLVMREITQVLVVSRSDSARSSDGKAIHKSVEEGQPTLIGRDALVNSLLLSRCMKILRTSSFLSAWSCVFNPNVTVELLNRPHQGKLFFPEKEILRRIEGAGHVLS